MVFQEQGLTCAAAFVFPEAAAEAMACATAVELAAPPVELLWSRARARRALPVGGEESGVGGWVGVKERKKERPCPWKAIFAAWLWACRYVVGETPSTNADKGRGGAAVLWLGGGARWPSRGLPPWSGFQCVHSLHAGVVF